MSENRIETKQLTQAVREQKSVGEAEQSMSGRAASYVCWAERSGETTTMEDCLLGLTPPHPGKKKKKKKKN